MIGVMVFLSIIVVITLVKLNKDNNGAGVIRRSHQNTSMDIEAVAEKADSIKVHRLDSESKSNAKTKKNEESLLDTINDPGKAYSTFNRFNSDNDF